GCEGIGGRRDVNSLPMLSDLVFEPPAKRAKKDTQDDAGDRLDNDSKFKAKFCKACKRRAGELDIDVDTPSDVKDFDVSSIEIFIELGLLTEAEFDAVSEGLTGSVLKAELEELPSHLGGSKGNKYFIVSLEGMSCSDIHSMRRMRVSCKFGLSHEQILLSAGKQLMEGQGSVLYEFHTSKHISNRPKHLKEEAGYHNIKTVEQLQSKVQKLMTNKGTADGKRKEQKVSSSDGENEKEGGERRVKEFQSQRLQPKQAQKKKAAKASAKKPQASSGGDDTAILDTDAIDKLPKALRTVADALKKTPQCFSSLDVGRILSGEKLMRSVDAVSRRLVLTNVC
ncbi:unnamed protein product, partial [Symbiodinium sp. KB8]